MAKNNRNQRQEPKYEDMLAMLKQNYENFKYFYYAALSKSGEHGKEGAKDGLYVSLEGLRKIGLEGILGGLETQAIQSIENGDGLNADLSLSKIISQNAGIFSETIRDYLRAKDLIQYIEKGFGKEIAKEKAYENKTIKQLTSKEASDSEKIYGNHLISQLRNSVMKEMTPIAHEARAEREDEKYTRDKNMIQLGNYSVRKAA